MKLRAPLTLAIAALALAASNCRGAQRLTELVVVVDGDLAFPGEADRVTVVADDGNGNVVSLPTPGSEAPRSGYRLPLWGSVAARGELRPVTFTATAYLGADVVLRQTAVAEFARDESREVRLTLCGACRHAQCGEGERCSEGVCASTRMSELPRWTGGEPARSTCSIDAGAGDAGLDADEQPDAAADADAQEELVCVGPQESEPNDEPSTADPFPASTTVCGLFEGDPDVFAFEHGDFGTIEISIDAPEPLEATAQIGGMVYDTRPKSATIAAPVVNAGTAIVTVRRGDAPVGKRVRYELMRTGP